ncbi:MAG: hypothetical protein A2563_04160 [Candidatus Magasanikbacteria bacterium RIFOXYD1_FULL_40_23]|uniref:2'-5' RNA ligase n=1 Tax=Candidatus Magasanikbacteria bacterium RIFOXYD1_FULL_40_23 TaxID=1798705 RepID=A0A1F6PA50_9BACT|nr:MAG: hypothetical protein A2563_04160 [Candidatus Magasanikbacteria bacterium RIFOXYD1_FULL_40_23]
MQFFIGITPPETISEKIISFQRNFLNNDVPNLVEPHITVKSTGGLTEDKLWLPKIESAINGFSKFQISFEGVGNFDENVIFLKPAFSQELINLHKTLFSAVGPYYKDPAKKYFENNEYHPHLTLGAIKWGLTKEDTLEMVEKARRELKNLPAFEVNSIRIYQKNDGAKSWHKVMDIKFGTN